MEGHELLPNKKAVAEKNSGITTSKMG